MNNLEQAARQALEVLRDLHESCQSNGEKINVADEICSLRAALEQPTDSAAFHGWVLRDVLFDNGEPVGHREPRQASHKCIVKDCKNHANQGVFVGDLCLPCHRFITTGEGVYSQAYRNAKQWVGLTDEEIESLYFDNFSKKQLRWFAFARAIEVKLKEKNT